MAEKLETMNLTLDMRYGPDKRKLNKLLKKGWTIAVQSTRSSLSFKPGQIDFVLTRSH